MKLYYHPASLEHDAGPYHPESPERIEAILAALEGEGVRAADLLQPEPVDLTLLAQVHDSRYIAAVEMVASRGGGYWDGDTFVSSGSYRAALMGAGCAVAAAESALEGEPAFALVRPPGHHALYSSAMGFCLFNNVAVAAQRCVNLGMERVLIVDWDVHHGNGTQDYFYSRPDVYFFSAHQYPFYPGTGVRGETGEGEGKGFTMNVPLPAGTGDEGYRRVFTEILTPLAEKYRPEVILVSAGYDAHAADPLGGMRLSVEGFRTLSRMVRQLSISIPECKGRIAFVLEGGYNTEVLGQCVVATISAVDEVGMGAER